MYNLTNVPTKAMDKDFEIKGVVHGEEIKIVCHKKYSEPNDWAMMTSTTVGDHMLVRPDDLRAMYARDLATAIRLGRDAGYEQAKAEIRAVLGAKAA